MKRKKQPPRKVALAVAAKQLADECERLRKACEAVLAANERLVEKYGLENKALNRQLAAALSPAPAAQETET